MGIRKISFKRFSEGDAFTSTGLQDRLDSLEQDINRAEDGLLRGAISEGALNYQHLASAGPAGTSNLNFGSSLVKAKTIRTEPQKSADAYYRYSPATMPDMVLAGVSGAGWSASRGRIVGSGGVPIGGFSPRRMSMDTSTNSIKLGTDFRDSNDSGYARGVLIMFDVSCLQSNENGTGFQLQFQDQTGQWHPILGSDRWVIDRNSRDDSISRKSPSTGRPINIRVWLSGDRAASLAFGLSSAGQDALEIHGFRAVVGATEAELAPGRGDDIHLGAAYLSIMAFRGFE